MEGDSRKSEVKRGGRKREMEKPIMERSQIKDPSEPNVKPCHDFRDAPNNVITFPGDTLDSQDRWVVGRENMFSYPH